MTLSELGKRIDAGKYRDDRASDAALRRHYYWLFLRWLLETGRLTV